MFLGYSFGLKWEVVGKKNSVSLYYAGKDIDQELTKS